MFHPDTQFLIDRWFDLARRPGVRAGVPARADFQPEILAQRLPRAFLAVRTGDDAVVRTAGGWVEGFHGGPLAGRPLLPLWRTASRPLVAAAMAQAVREGRPVVIAALAGSPTAGLEVTFTPLRDASGAPDLLLGLYGLNGAFDSAADEPRRLTARVSIGVGDPGRAALSLAAVDGRRIA